MEDQLWHRLEVDGLLTRGEIGLARARHAAAGGAPDTAIMEVRPLTSEERAHLRHLLARVMEHPVAPPAFLEAPEADALAFVPRELADRFSVLAVRLTPDVLTVVTPAVSSRVLAELSFVAGRKVQPCVALESDIRHALARHLGLPLPPRFQALGAPQPTPVPLAGTGPAPAGEALRAVAPGWGQSTPTPGIGSLRPLRMAESGTPASGLGQRDWVARALETLRAARTPADFDAVLAHLAVPGMCHVVFLRVVPDGLMGVAAATDGVPVPGITTLRVRPETDSIIGRAVDRGATRCGAFREDVAFRQLYGGLNLPAPGDVLVVPLKRGERVQGVFVGDNGPQTIAPLTASAVRRLLAGLVELWPEPEGEVVTREVGLSPLDADVGTARVLEPPASPGPPAATFPVFRALRRPTAELVSLPPQASPAVDADLPSGALESEPGLPEWELPGEPTVPVGVDRPSSPTEPRQEAGDAALVDLFTSADVAELALLDEPPPPDLTTPTTATRPGVPVLSTRPLLPAVVPATPATGAIADTLVEMRPMALAELVDALTAEARPTQTLAAVSALKEPGPAPPRPQLLDLDDMATVPAMERVRPRMAAEAPPPTATPAPAAPRPEPEPAPEPPRSLPFPTPGWTDEIPVPVVTAIRRGLVDVEPQTEVEAPAVRFRAIGAGPSLQGDGPKPAGGAPSMAPTPFDPPSGPMPRVTVTLTPRPVDPEPGPPDPEPVLAPTAPPPPAPAAALPAAPPRRTTDADVEAALEALSRPDAAVRQQAEDLLLSVGEPALAPIFQAFPGHLLVDRFAQPAGAVAVEQHSALLRVVVRLGPLAAKPLEALCGHLSPEIRYYAVYAFSTLRSQSSLPIVAARLADSDASVRDIAVHVLEQYRGQAAFKEVVAELREALRTAPPRRRRPVIEAAGRLHLAEAIPELVAHLGDLASGLHEPAHRALQEIARADFGLDAWKWQKWHERNGHRPRVEWLLDGLLSDTRAIRAGAFQELRRLTHQNYGYLVDAPPAERRSGHERWLKWWRDVGMTRFAGYR